MNAFLNHLQGQRSHHAAQHTGGPSFILVVASPAAGGNTHTMRMMMMMMMSTTPHLFIRLSTALHTAVNAPKPLVSRH